MRLQGRFRWLACAGLLLAIPIALSAGRGRALVDLPARLTDLEFWHLIASWSGYAVRASPTYDELMTATDAVGVPRGFLATEEQFALLKDLETRNLVVPIVGDFGGPTAIRAVAAYLRAQGAAVEAFYLSNVEQYLYQDGKWDAFCRNVATLPMHGGSTFIRSSSGGGGFGRGVGFVSSLGAMAAEVKGCGSGGFGVLKTLTRIQ